MFAGLQIANWVSEGSQRAPKRDPKMTQNRSEIHPGGPWHAQGCQGVPHRCLRSSQHAFLCIFIHIVGHVIHFCTYLCISMHFQACLWMCMYIWDIFVHICVLYEYVYIFTHIYSWEDADLLSTKSHAAGLHSTGSWNICKYTQYKFVSKLYRKHRHTFERWTGMTPWHGGGLGAVRL